MTREPVRRLIVVPTLPELELLKESLEKRGLLKQIGNDWQFELCGFGPIGSAIGMMKLLNQYDTQDVILVGIAGGYGDDAVIGSAVSLEQVACYGVGAGSGVDFQTAAEIGWPQLSSLGLGQEAAAGDVGADVITLAKNKSKSVRSQPSKLLLSVCACAANASDVEMRLRKFPDASVEDMEGFSVAAACLAAGASLQIIRGISNRAGDRDKRNWKIRDAIVAAADLLTEQIYR